VFSLLCGLVSLVLCLVGVLVGTGPGSVSLLGALISMAGLGVSWGLASTYAMFSFGACMLLAFNVFVSNSTLGLLWNTGSHKLIRFAIYGATLSLFTTRQSRQLRQLLLV